MANRRESGIRVVGRIPWSTHFGLFYRTKQDLIDVLVPYFKAGLENNEFCIWVTAEPLGSEEARMHLSRAMPGFDSYVDNGQIEIIPHTEWYTIGGVFDAGRVLNRCVDKLREAEKRGFSGVRLTGNESWLDRGVWRDFIDYEQAVNGIVCQHKMIIVCSYPQDKCDAGDVLDVAGTHQFFLSKRNGGWKLTEDQEQKKTRIALRRSEAHLAKSQEIAHLGSWELNSGDNRLTWSDEVYRIFGVKPKEFEATYKAFLAMVHPEDRGAVDNVYRDSVRDGKDSYEVEHRIIRKSDGEVRYVHEKCKHFRNDAGEIVRSMGMVHDITERRRAEEALRQSEERYRALVETSPDAIIVHRNGRFIYANPAALRLHGADSFDRLRGRSVLDVIHPDYRESTLARIKKVEQGEETPARELTVLRLDGQPLQVEAAASQIYFEGGKAMQVIFRDITERMRTQEALKMAKAQAELYVDLMGHDINNMNQISLGFLELAHNIIGIDGKLGADNLVLLDKAMDSLENSSRLIDNVRKLQREKMGLYKPEVIDVGRMVEGTVKQFRHTPGRDVIVSCSAPEHCLVRANALLNDVFVNLVGNAIKHSNGTKKLAIGVRAEKVRKDGADYCLVSVEDNGPGIPDELKETLFDRLSLDSTRARGKGFGLCLIKMLMDDYRGKFWVEDRVKGDHTKGARFMVMLPAVSQ